MAATAALHAGGGNERAVPDPDRGGSEADSTEGSLIGGRLAAPKVHHIDGRDQAGLIRGWRTGECAATARMAGYRHEQMAGRVGPKGGCNPTVAPDPTDGAG